MAWNGITVRAAGDVLDAGAALPLRPAAKAGQAPPMLAEEKQGHGG